MYIGEFKLFFTQDTNNFLKQHTVSKFEDEMGIIDHINAFNILSYPTFSDGEWLCITICTCRSDGKCCCLNAV